MVNISYHYSFRKSLLFLCLSVASAVFFQAETAYSATTTDPGGSYVYVYQGSIHHGQYSSTTLSTFDDDCSEVSAYMESFTEDCIAGDVRFDYPDPLDTNQQLYIYYFFAVDAYDNAGYSFDGDTGGSGAIQYDDVIVKSYSQPETETYFYQIDVSSTTGSYLDYWKFTERDHASESRRAIGFVISPQDVNVSSITSYDDAISLIRSVAVDTYSTSTLASQYTYGFNSTYNTRFTDLQFTDLEPSSPPTPVHSHIQLDLDYYIDSTEIDVNLSARNPTQIKYAYSLRPGTDITNVYDAFTTPITYGNGSSTIEIQDLDDGTYDLFIQFSNIGSALGLSAVPFDEAYVYTEFTISGSRLTATGTVNYSDALSEPERYYDCSLTQFDNCLKNAGIFLFVPSDDSLDNFYTLRESIDDKFPFNYISDFKDAFDGFYTTATSKSLTITVPFGEFGNITLLSADLINDVPLAGTIRTILGYLLWVMLVYQIYRRTLYIFNSSEKTA